MEIRKREKQKKNETHLFSIIHFFSRYSSVTKERQTIRKLTKIMKNTK